MRSLFTMSFARKIGSITAGLWILALLAGLSGHTLAQDDTLSPITVENAPQLRLYAGLSGHQSEVIQSTFNADGTLLATASFDATLRLWDVASGEALHVLEADTRLFDTAFSPDGQLVAAAGRDGILRVWDVESGTLQAELSGHLGAIVSLAFTPDSAAVLTAGEDNTLRRWEVASQTETVIVEPYTPTLEQLAMSMDVHPTEGLVALGSGQPGGGMGTAMLDSYPVLVYDLASGELVQTFDGHTGEVWGVQFSADGTRLVSASEDSTVRVWDVRTGELERVLEGHTNELQRGAAWGPNGDLIVSGGFDKQLILWDAARLEPAAQLEGGPRFIDSVAFSPAGTLIATGHFDGSVRLWAIDEDAPAQSPQDDAQDATPQATVTPRPTPTTVQLPPVTGELSLNSPVTLRSPSVGQQFVFTYAGTADETLVIRNDSLGMVVQLTGPDGSAIAELPSGTTTVTLPADGTYTVEGTTESPGFFHITLRQASD